LYLDVGFVYWIFWKNKQKSSMKFPATKTTFS